MEKIKNILSGKDKDDEKTYQSGHNTSTATSGTGPTTGNISGQGSHFGGETRTGMTGVTGSQVSSHMPGEYPTDASAAGYSTASTQPGDGRVSTTTAVPHSSNLANRVDPRVDSDLDNSRTVGNTGTHSNTQGTGYGSGVGSTAVSSTTTGPHSSNLANKADPRVDSDFDGSKTAGYSRTSGTNAGSAAIGSTTTARSFPLGSSTGSTNAGPHSSNIANQADPRVDSDRDGSRTTGHTAGTAAIGSTTTARSFPLGGTGSSTTGGPHSSDLANKVDPRFDSRLAGASGTTMDRSYPIQSGSGNTGTTSTGYDTSTTGNTSTTMGSGHHLGRDAAAAGTAAAVGEGVHHHNQQSSLGSTTGSSAPASRGFHTTSGPHQTDTANRLDPHVAGGVGREDAFHHDEKRGGGAEEADSSHRTTGTTSADATRIGDINITDRTTGGSSHTVRNAALGAGVGATAGGLAAHEYNSQHGGQNSGLGNTSGMAGTGLSSGTNSSNTYSRDQTPGLGNTSGATGVGLSSGASRDLAGNTYGRDNTTTGTSSHHGRDAALGTAAGVGAAGLAKHEYDNRHAGQTSSLGKTSSTGHSSTQPTTTNYGTTTGSSSHHGRDAALGAGAGIGAAGAAGLAKHEYDNRHTGQTSSLGNTSNTGHSTTQSTTENDPNTSSSHHARDATLGAGAGVGAAGAAGYAMHEHDKNRTQRDSATTGTTTTTTTTTESKYYGHHKDHKDNDTKDRDHKSGGLFSHHDRDRNIATGSATTHHERDHNTGVGNTTSHHTGRDVALGTTAGAAAAGAGAKGARDLTLHGQDRHVATEGDFDQDGNPIGGSSNLSHAGDGTKAGHHEPNPATAMYVREAQKAEDKRHGSGSHGHDKLGDHLHGRRQSGVVGSSGFPDQPGFGDGHVPSAYETTGGATTGAHYGQPTSSAVRASGLSEHEHDTSRSGGNYTTGTGHLGTGDASSAPRKLSEGAFDQDGKPIASHGIPSAYGVGDKTATGSDGHTRLHKDPPAGHPASHTTHHHGSGKELERDTGVSGSGGAHYASPNS